MVSNTGYQPDWSIKSNVNGRRNPYSFLRRYVKLRKRYGRSEIFLHNFTTTFPPPVGVLWLAARALGPAAGVEVGSPAGNELSGRRTESLGNWDSCKVPDSRGNWVSCSSV